MANQKRTQIKNKTNPPLIPYGRQKIDADDIRSVINVLKSDWLTQGPLVKKFEDALAKYCGAKFAVAVSNGTAALHLAYLAAGIGTGDEIITSPNTFPATTNMLLTIGARPVFCDIRLDNYNVDESKLESLITDKTKAIVPVHFAGHPCEMDNILKLAKKHNILVIEDACHALGATYKDRKIGNIGDMTIFSFHPVKSITTGEGGAILTNNKNFYEKLLSLRSHGIIKDKKGFNVMTELGHNYRITDIQAALGLSQLKKLDGFIKKRDKVMDIYYKELKGLKDIVLPKITRNIVSASHILVIRVKDQAKRLKLMEFLKSKGIGINFHYPAVYSHPYYRQNGYKELSLANEETYHNSCITLPLYPDLGPKNIKYICNNIKTFFK